MTAIQDIKQTVLINAPIEKVWSQVSTAKGIEAWFMPSDFEATVGHQFHIQSPFGPSPCKVLEVDEPHLIKFLWDTDGWVVSFLLKKEGDNTEFIVIHGGWKSSDEVVPKAGEDASVIRERMNGGWAGIVQSLKKVVEQ